MKTELKDVLHLYKGCKITDDEGKEWTMGGANTSHDGILVVPVYTDEYTTELYPDNDSVIKPILRPLSDITNEEISILCSGELRTYLEISASNFKELTAQQFLYLLKQGFDLFGLIWSGQAIDKTKLK